MDFSGDGLSTGPTDLPASESVSPSRASNTTRTDSNGTCGTMAMSTGSGLATLGKPRSAKCTLITLALLPADTAATISGGRPATLLAACGVEGAVVDCSGASSHAARSAAHTSANTANGARLLELIYLLL